MVVIGYPVRRRGWGWGLVDVNERIVGVHHVAHFIARPDFGGDSDGVLFAAAVRGNEHPAWGNCAGDPA